MNGFQLLISDLSKKSSTFFPPFTVFFYGLWLERPAIPANASGSRAVRSERVGRYTVFLSDFLVEMPLLIFLNTRRSKYRNPLGVYDNRKASQNFGQRQSFC
jgi:hypothetical protein